MDVVPSATFPFFVLGTPFMGFQSITAPEYTAEVDEIKQVNSMFKRHAYSGGSVGPMTLTRGVRGYDDTMWEWMHRAIKGMESTNRHLLLIHYTGIGVGSVGKIGAQMAAFDFPSPWEGERFVPGKAWLLWDAIPIRYKAASDFDAMSGAASVAELDIQPWAMTEFTLLDPI
jgi:phage tail-like protein